MPVLDWQRSWALAGFALPLVLWLLARRPLPPRERATGTLSIWREVLDGSIPAPARRGRGVPLRLYFLLLGLVLGTLAAAGPRLRTGESAEWRVVLNTRSRMFLPWIDAGAVRGNTRRIDVALSRAVDQISGRAVWMRYVDGRWEEQRGADPPAAWLEPPTHDPGEPPWSEVDREDYLWLTDRIPAARAASWIASGGGAVDGLVGRRGGRLLLLENGELVEGQAIPAPRLFVAADVPRELAELTAAWARERGFELVADAGDDALRVETAKAADGDRRVRGPDWLLVGKAARAAGGQVFWRDEAGRAALAVRPGRVELGLTDPLRIEGDREGLALSWIEALESAALPPAGSVPLAQRVEAGPGGSSIGAGPREGGPTGGSSLVSWLCLASCLAVAVALRPTALRL